MKPTQSRAKLSAKTFTEAAKHIPEALYACCAIDEATGQHTFRNCENPHNHFFELVTKPKRRGGLGLYSYAWYGDLTARNQQARVIALLLCAELVRDGWTVEGFLEGSK